MATDTAADLATEQQRIAAEIRELDLLVESTQTEVNRLKAREEQTKLRVSEVRGNPGNFQREEIFGATDDYATAIGRRMTMEGQLGTLQAKRKLLDRAKSLVSAAQQHVRDNAAAPLPADASPVIDESRLLQAVVDTQEAERKRIARQVHDGPAQAMANVVLQSEISERLFEVDPQRSRTELAALRQMVNKTLQELRGFIFELRPMILDDLGLVPTMRRYVQTLVDKHGIRIDFSSTGRDRRLPSDDEVAIFRLIQDSLVERIEKGASKDIVLGMGWKDEQLDIMLQADGKELPPDGELQSGLRRSERLELLHGESTHETRADGTVVLSVKVPIRAAPAIIT
ncbi:MAG TPA: histidine kinase [Candidatus Limnocylindria bacterium]|nr:histidine kinase [Candidatus Limnocylindria bacterium]